MPEDHSLTITIQFFRFHIVIDIFFYKLIPVKLQFIYSIKKFKGKSFELFTYL